MVYKIDIIKIFTNLLQSLPVVQPVYTPAETPLIDNLKNEFNTAVNNGLEPTKIVKMVSIMALVSERGITDLQTHQALFVQLCMDSNFSVMDHNINHIVHQLNQAKNA